MTAGAIVVDARGMRCPWPALRLARAIRGGARDVEIFADDPIAPTELAAVATAQGCAFETLADNRFRVFSSQPVNGLFTADS